MKNELQNLWKRIRLLALVPDPDDPPNPDDPLPPPPPEGGRV